MCWSEQNELPISMRLKRVKLLDPAQLFEEQIKITQRKSRNISDADKLLRIDYLGIVSVTKMERIRNTHDL